VMQTVLERLVVGLRKWRTVVGTSPVSIHEALSPHRLTGLEVIHRKLSPDRQALLHHLIDRYARKIADLGPMKTEIGPGHNDLGLSNILVDYEARRTPIAVIDFEGSSRDAILATDLLTFLVSRRKHEARSSFGEAIASLLITPESCPDRTVWEERTGFESYMIQPLLVWMWFRLLSNHADTPLAYSNWWLRTSFDAVSTQARLWLDQ
jgi:hypothetical protein